MPLNRPNQPMKASTFFQGACFCDSRAVNLNAFCIAFISGCAFNAVLAVEVMPSKPAHYFNDYAGIVSQSVGGKLDRQLSQFERATSNQVMVASFSKMQSDSDIADYTQRVAQAWGVVKRNAAMAWCSLCSFRIAR